MKPQKIHDVQAYDALIERYSDKGTISNNYMLSGEVSDLISQRRLYACHDENNCWFLVEKPAGVARVYYLINDMEKASLIECESSLVTEILFRGNSGVPSSEINYLERCGFKKNLQRDQYAAILGAQEACEPVFARSTEDSLIAIELFNSSFDKYSGDYIPQTDAQALYDSKSLLCCYSGDGILQASLQISFAGRNAWVSHLVVDSKYRGLGLSDMLMKMFVMDAINHECKRLMLWVQTQNEIAVSLYKKYGFTYTNKSTISLIKE